MGGVSAGGRTGIPKASRGALGGREKEGPSLFGGTYGVPVFFFLLNTCNKRNAICIPLKVYNYMLLVYRKYSELCSHPPNLIVLMLLPNHPISLFKALRRIDIEQQAFYFIEQISNCWGD